MLFLFYVGAPLAVILFSAYHILHVHGHRAFPTFYENAVSVTKTNPYGVLVFTIPFPDPRF